jgi:hypothetical protein
MFKVCLVSSSFSENFAGIFESFVSEHIVRGGFFLEILSLLCSRVNLMSRRERSFLEKSSWIVGREGVYMSIRTDPSDVSIKSSL